MTGQDLLKILIEATGLPEDLIRPEMNALLAARGVSVDTLTLNELREALELYLQQILLQAKEASRG